MAQEWQVKPPNPARSTRSGTKFLTDAPDCHTLFSFIPAVDVGIGKHLVFSRTKLGGKNSRADPGHKRGFDDTVDLVDLAPEQPYPIG